jgi:hypothetical protein
MVLLSSVLVVVIVSVASKSISFGTDTDDGSKVIEVVEFTIGTVAVGFVDRFLVNGAEATEPAEER